MMRTGSTTTSFWLTEESMPLKLRAMIGLIPLLAVQVLDEDAIRPVLPEFHKRTEWFLANRKDLIKRVAEIEIRGEEPRRHMLLALPGRNRLERALRYLLDESEFLSPYGVRSLSRVYKDRPYVFRADGDTHEYKVAYVPGDMDSTGSLVATRIGVGRFGSQSIFC